MTIIQRNDATRENRALLLPFLSRKGKVLSNESIVISSYSTKTTWKNGGDKNTSTAENEILNLIDQIMDIAKAQKELSASDPARHPRNRRSESVTEIKQCESFIFVIRYEDPYEVWNNFSVKYKGRIYPYDTYRVNKDGLHVCNSSDHLVQRRWSKFTAWERYKMLHEHCNVSVDSFYHENYTLLKDFTVVFKPTNQSFTTKDYGVILGYFSICSAKLSLSCNHYLINVKYDEPYLISNDFSLTYDKRRYNYREYRINNNMLVICASNHSAVLGIWRTRNSLERSAFLHTRRCKIIWAQNDRFHTVNKQLTLYSSPSSQYFTRHDYVVRNGKLGICLEILKPVSFQFTNEDLLMCNDSIVNIRYDDEYEVLNNVSMLYRNKMYSYTEYRALNDSIKICNSTDNFVNNIWKLRNYWVMKKGHTRKCDKLWKENSFYTVNKQFTVYFSSRSQYFTRHDYHLMEGKPVVCEKMLRPTTYEYAKDDFSMCNDSIINIKYDDDYKVWNNFSILYKNKMYSYTEYRALNDSIKICNSTDNFVNNIWKLRNYWVMKERHTRKCDERWKQYSSYTVNKQFTVYFSSRSQYFTRHDYDLMEGNPFVCREMLRPISYQYAKDDFSVCNDSIINIKYDDEYKVWNNFSILYKNKMYSYTEYRALNDTIKICNSHDNFVKNIWKSRNYWIMATKHTKSCETTWYINKGYYFVSKEFTVYASNTGQYLTRHDYDVLDGKPEICDDKLRAESHQHMKEDLLMCNDSIINIKYNDDYKVWNNFSILYKNKMYSSNEYRALKDGIKICNSHDNFVRNVWKLRNNWVMWHRYFKTCNEPVVYFPLYHGEFEVLRNLTVFIQATKLLIAKNDYGSYKGTPLVCVNKCVNSTFIIKFEDEYSIWSNFTVMYKGEMYHHFEYRITDDGLQICNSTDRLINEKWRNLVALEKRAAAYTDCYGQVSGFYHQNYTVHKNFSVFFKPTTQRFRRRDYGVISGYFVICSAKLSLSCDSLLIELKYNEEFEVFGNFSIFYNNTVYDYAEYRFSLNGVKVCASNDERVQAIWKTQNKWEKSLGAPCYNSYKLSAKHYTITKEFAIHSTDDGQYFGRYDYGVIDASPYVCWQNPKPNYIIADVKIIIVPLCALALSFISLVLLLIIYFLLPELRTLPGLNLMSLSFAFLLWQIYLVVFLSSYSFVSKLVTIPCERLFVTTKFITYSIVMNAAVNIYHLRKTFCGNTLVKSENVNKWRKFLRYTVFSWGIPVAVTILYIVLVKTHALKFNQYAASVKGNVHSSLRFYQRIELADEDARGDILKFYPHTIAARKNFAPHIRLKQELDKEDKRNGWIQKNNPPRITTYYERVVLEENENNNARIYHHIIGDCINGRVSPDWSTAVDVYGIQGCLMLYIVVTFILTAYKIRQKLKAGRRIAQKSNVVKRRKFVLLLKLSTTTALSYWFPMFISEIIDINFDIKIALYTVTLLTGVYIGIAFGFTGRNYELLKKKYFPVKERPVKNRLAANL